MYIVTTRPVRNVNSPDGYEFRTLGIFDSLALAEKKIKRYLAAHVDCVCKVAKFSDCEYEPSVSVAKKKVPKLVKTEPVPAENAA